MSSSGSSEDVAQLTKERDAKLAQLEKLKVELAKLEKQRDAVQKLLDRFRQEEPQILALLKKEQDEAEVQVRKIQNEVAAEQRRHDEEIANAKKPSEEISRTFQDFTERANTLRVEARDRERRLYMDAVTIEMATCGYRREVIALRDANQKLREWLQARDNPRLGLMDSVARDLKGAPSLEQRLVAAKRVRELKMVRERVERKEAEKEEIEAAAAKWMKKGGAAPKPKER